MSRPIPLLSRRAARGLTFVEVVLASALLALAASTVFGTFGYLVGRQRLEQQKLGAMETANRLMLQYLDDVQSLPQANLPVMYGTDRYRWEMMETPVKLKPAEPATPQAAAGLPRDRPTLLDRIKQVTFKVWLSEESGGTFALDENVPNATLTRMIYPTFNRNPDSLQHMLDDPAAMRRFRDEFMSDGPNPSSGTPGSGANPTKVSPSNVQRIGPGSTPTIRPK